LVLLSYIACCAAVVTKLFTANKKSTLYSIETLHDLQLIQRKLALQLEVVLSAKSVTYLFVYLRFKIHINTKVEVQMKSEKSLRCKKNAVNTGRRERSTRLCNFLVNDNGRKRMLQSRGSQPFSDHVPL